jgi:hypothetical protein
LEVVPYESVGT